MPDFPFVNGNMVSHVSLQFNAGGVPFTGIKSLDFSDSNERGMAWGNSRQIYGRTAGKYMCEAKFVIYYADAESFELLMTQNGQIGTYDAFQNLIFTYAELALPTGLAIPPPPQIYTRTLSNVVLKKISEATSEGNEPAGITYEVQPMAINRGGRNPYTNFIG